MSLRLVVVSLVVVLLAAQGVLAAKPANPATAPPPSTAPGSKTSNDIVQAAANAGIKTCLPRIEQITNSLLAGAQSGAFLLAVSPQPDQQLSSTTMEVQLPSGVTSFVSITSAPDAAGGCANTYETVSHWVNSCSEVAQKAYPKLKAAASSWEHIAVLEGGPTLRIYLLPAGEQGCISIKREVIF